MYNSQQAINYIYVYSVVLANEENCKKNNFIYHRKLLYNDAHGQTKVFGAPLKLNAINFVDCTDNQTSILKF